MLHSSPHFVITLFPFTTHFIWFKLHIQDLFSFLLNEVVLWPVNIRIFITSINFVYIFKKTGKQACAALCNRKWFDDIVRNFSDKYGVYQLK